MGDGGVRLIENFLKGRTQPVECGGGLSSSIAAISGVPQGSILGPVLFAIYTSNLSAALSEANVHMYVDDTQIYLGVNENNFVQKLKIFNDELGSLVTYSRRHSLSIHPSK